MTTANVKPNKPAARTAITPTRADNFPEWYQQVIKESDLAENAPVRGCMIIKPYGYAIWENIQHAFDKTIKREGVQNAYFPLLIPLSFIAKEAEHIDGFAKECAVVTHHRLAKNAKGELAPDPESILAEPMIIRPTSETIIGESFSRWVQSYRDLPLKINQWANVMRWEMRPRLFLRTSEFLWQEGHNVLETAEAADKDARRMLDVYKEFFEQFLAIPPIVGVKTPEERFPGAVETYTVETVLQDGKALQAATSHNLGQTFAKSSDIKFQGRDGGEQMAWTTSWGMSTRTIGGLIMCHGDDDGMIVPPRLAPHQVVIIPIVRDENDRAAIVEFCSKLDSRLAAQGIRVLFDQRDMQTPDKMWGWIKRGVPVRVEIGMREVADGKLTSVRRDLGKESKKTLTADEFCNGISGELDSMQKAMLETAKARMAGQIHDISSIKEMRDFFAAETQGCVRMDVALLKDSGFDAVRKEFSLTPRCMPFADDGRKVIVGKAY